MQLCEELTEVDGAFVVGIGLVLVDHVL